MSADDENPHTRGNAVAEAKRAEVEQEKADAGSAARAPIAEGEQQHETGQLTCGSDDRRDAAPAAANPFQAEGRIAATGEHSDAACVVTAAADFTSGDTGAASDEQAVRHAPAVTATVGSSTIASSVLQGEISVEPRPRGRPFAKGRSGNPKGRPRGSRNKASLMIEAVLEGSAEIVAKKAVEMAAAGDTKMIPFVLSRIVPPKREPTVCIDIPPLESPTACRIAKAKTAEAAAAGAISSAEAARQIANIDAVLRSLHELAFESDYERQKADFEKDRLFAAYPYSLDVDVDVQRYFAFRQDLFALKLAERECVRIWLEYYRGLSDEAREIVDKMEDRVDE